MMSTLAAVLILLQGIILAQSDTGTITGTLRTESGAPAKGVRLAVVASSAASADRSGTEMLSIAETDPEGRFVLENIPPGKYVITAGRLSAPTFYPGTADVTRATVLSVTKASTTRSIDFTIGAASLNLSQQAGNGDIYYRMQAPPAKRTVPGKVVIEGEAPSAAIGMVVVAKRFDGQTADAMVRADGSFLLSLPDGQYSVSTLLVPLGYRVKTAVAGPVNLLSTNPLVISASANASLEITLQRTSLD
jgi:hypothetical protein